VGGTNAGTGASLAYTFNAASAADTNAAATTVQVTLGTITVAVLVIVYELKAKLTSRDNFVGHRVDNFGTDERVDLDFETVPAGVTAASLGGLKWEIDGTAGRDQDGVVWKAHNDPLAPDPDGKGHYVAPYKLGEPDYRANPYFLLPENKDTKLKLTVQTGPFKDQKVEKTVRIWTPRAHMTVETGSELHAHNRPSAGFKGLIHLHPKFVSFQTLEWRESIGLAVAKNSVGEFGRGYFKFDHNKRHQTTTFTANTAMPVLAGNQNTGCWINQRDQVWSGWDPSWVAPAVVPAPAAVAVFQAAPAPRGVLTRVANAAFMQVQVPTGNRQAQVTEPSTIEWPIEWQYRVRLNPPNGQAWLTFQVVVHKCEVDGNGTVKTSKGSPNQPWPLAAVTRALAAANSWNPAFGGLPANCACID
jgi:hypothetical protein